MHRLLIAAALLLLAPLATAQVYKWTDANGTVHYSEAPPAEGTHYSKVTTTGSVQPLARSAAGATPEPGSETGHVSTPAPRTMADTPANRKELCASLEANLATLHGSDPVVMEQAGKSSALDAAQRKQQIETAQAQHDQYCRGQ